MTERDQGPLSPSCEFGNRIMNDEEFIEQLTDYQLFEKHSAPRTHIIISITFMKRNVYKQCKRDSCSETLKVHEGRNPLNLSSAPSVYESWFCHVEGVGGNSLHVPSH